MAAPGRRLLDKREGGEFPFRYRPAVDTDVRRTIRAATTAPSVAEAERILRSIWLLRDAYKPGPVRDALNDASVAMSAAISKICEQEKCQK